MENNNRVSLVVPVYNEQDVIAETVEVFLRDLASVCSDYELIVVDDGSTDHTAGVLKELQSRYPDKLRVITNKKNLGSGRSLMVGFEHVRFPLAATNFADRPFHTAELKNIFPLFVHGADFVVVCRQDRSANTLYRKLTSLVNYYCIRFLFNIRINDFQFVQVYRRDMVRKINVDAHHTFVPPELMIRALAQGCRMAEYKTNFYPRTKGAAKCGHPAVILCALRDMVRFWFRLNVVSRFDANKRTVEINA